jgi:hypothetical protein
MHIFLPCRFFQREQHTMMARGYGRFYHQWCCHPQCDHCRFITTPWVMPPTFGFIGIDRGGENYLPFHQLHSGNFMPYANHQQIWPVEIARGAATPDAIIAASSQHHGQCPLRSVLSKQWGGASNWEGSAGVIKKRFVYTRQSTRMRLIALPVELSPPFWFVPLHPNTMGDSPYIWF